VSRTAWKGHRTMQTQTDVMAVDACALVLVDYQERLMPALHDAAAAVANAVRLAEVARLLGVPVVGTEQAPASLGPSVEPLRTACAITLAKLHFDACADGLVQMLRQTRPGVSEVVVAGCEAHVCLMQTALGLLRAGLRVWVVADACASRRSGNHAAAMARLTQAGATVVTLEMVMFEWLANSCHPKFRDVLKQITRRYSPPATHCSR